MDWSETRAFERQSCFRAPQLLPGSAEVADEAEGHRVTRESPEVDLFGRMHVGRTPDDRTACPEHPLGVTDRLRPHRRRVGNGPSVLRLAVLDQRRVVSTRDETEHHCRENDRFQVTF